MTNATNAAFNEDKEKPLDPAVEKVRRKMVRLMIISASSLFLSLMAVLGAIVYKSSRSETEIPAMSSAVKVPDHGILTLSAMVPEGFTLTSASLNNGQVLMTGTKTGGETVMYIYDIHAGRVITTISLDKVKNIAIKP